MSSGASGDRKRTPDEFLTRPDLEELLKEMKTECTNSIAGVMENALRKADANYQARFFKIESELMELKARVAQLEGWKPEVERQTSAMRQAVAMAEDKVPVASALDQEDFEKDPDLTIIRARAMDAITPSSLLDALGEIVDAMSLEKNQYEIKGKELDKVYVIKFKGATGLAARRARKFLSLQRDSDGWKNFFAKTPDGADTRVYLDGDKNRKQIRKEVLSRKLQRVLKEKYPNNEFFNRKRDATISSDWVPLARVVVPDPDTFRVEWNLKRATELSIDRAAVDEAFKIAAADRDETISWG